MFHHGEHGESNLDFLSVLRVSVVSRFPCADEDPEARGRPVSFESRFPWAQMPAPSVPGSMDLPSQVEAIGQFLECRLVKELNTRDSVGAKSIAPLKLPMLLHAHLIPMFDAPVEWGIQYDNPAGRPQDSARFP